MPAMPFFWYCHCWSEIIFLCCTICWEQSPLQSRSSSTLTSFKSSLKSHLLKLSGWLCVRVCVCPRTCSYELVFTVFWYKEDIIIIITFIITFTVDEHPEGTLTVDNFTFIRKPICEEPWETVRQAGKSCGRRPQKESRISPSHVSPSQNTPKISRVKIKIGTGATKKVTIITDTPSSSSSKTPTTSHSSSRKSTYIRYDDDEEDDGNDYDEDYDPWKDDQTPKWNKTRSIFHRQKGRRRSRQSPTREVLIQSMPEPDIIIDRAEESPHIDESDASKKEKTRDVSESKAPRMMLLPGEIKEETLDVDGEAEGEDKDDNNSNDIGTVHIHCSPPVKRVHTKPTARKSTMPRIALKKSRWFDCRKLSLFFFICVVIVYVLSVPLSL